MKLESYLAELNSADETWGVWVDPENPDNYRIGQRCFENGGIKDEFVFIGSLQKLSFGFQDESAIFREVAESEVDGHHNIEELYELWAEQNLEECLQQRLDLAMEKATHESAVRAAQQFIEDELPYILAGE